VASKCPLPLQSKCLCHREGPLPSWCSCLCHRRAFTFKVALLLPSMGRCLQSALAFGIEGPFPSNTLCLQRPSAIERPSPSNGLCHRRAFCFKPTLYT
jgi:hypothetical protein